MAPEVEYTVKEVPVERTFALRKAVLRPYLADEEEFRLDDDLLESTVAFAAVTAQDDVIGVARLSPEPPPFEPDGAASWRLRAMATHPDARNRGVGGAVLRAAVEHVAQHGGGLLWCNARVPAINLYARGGMKPWGEVWEEPEIGPHIVMWRNVSPMQRVDGLGYAAMTDSPLQAAIREIDALDLDGLISLFAPDARLTTVYGQEANGRDQVRSVLGGFFAELRATEHQVTSDWNPVPGVWISEMSASYELTDFSRRGPYRRAMICRAGADGIQELHLYGAHEEPLPESSGAYKEVRGPHGWLPTL